MARPALTDRCAIHAEVLSIDRLSIPELLGTPAELEIRAGDECLIDVTAVGGSKGGEAVVISAFLAVSLSHRGAV